MTPPENSRDRGLPSSGLARHLGLFTTTMAVMGGIIGAGIFINPYLVAERVHTSSLILAVWTAGGVVALLGCFIYSELAGRLLHMEVFAPCARQYPKRRPLPCYADYDFGP